MRIVDAEPQLIKELIDELQVVARKEKGAVSVYAGRHTTLGKVVVIESAQGDGMIIEVEE